MDARLFCTGSTPCFRQTSSTCLRVQVAWPEKISQGNGSSVQTFFEMGDRLLVLESQPLKVAYSLNLGPKRDVKDFGNGYRVLFMGADSDRLFEIGGNAFFETMLSESLSHEISFSLIDVNSGTRTWTHCENILVRKTR